MTIWTWTDETGNNDVNQLSRQEGNIIIFFFFSFSKFFWKTPLNFFWELIAATYYTRYYFYKVERNNNIRLVTLVPAHCSSKPCVTWKTILQAETETTTKMRRVTFFATHHAPQLSLLSLSRCKALVAKFNTNAACQPAKIKIIKFII